MTTYAVIHLGPIGQANSGTGIHEGPSPAGTFATLDATFAGTGTTTDEFGNITIPDGDGGQTGGPTAINFNMGVLGVTTPTDVIKAATDAVIAFAASRMGVVLKAHDVLVV